MGIVNWNVCSRALSRAAVGCDVMIVDPPYSEKVHTKATSTRTGGVGVRTRDFGFRHRSPELMLRLAEYASQVRRWSVVFSDVESSHLWRAAMALHRVEYVRSVPWVRWSQPQVTGDRPPTGAELIIIFHAHRPKGFGKMHWSGSGGRVAYAEKCLRGKDKFSCEKPLDLMLSLVSDFSDVGETVFDPCMGSGTTAQACQLLDREVLGVEALRPAYLLAEERLRTEISKRNRERAERWVVETVEEARTVPAPKGRHDIRTYERAQRRISDATRVVEKLQ